MKLSICSLCLKSFVCKSNLYRHLRRIHKEEHENRDKEFKCICGKQYSHRRGLVAHIKDQCTDANKSDYPGRLYKVFCPICGMRLSSYGNLRTHLIDHDVNVEEETLSFLTIDDFKNWKRRIEITTHSFYIRSTSPYITADGTKKTLFHCHRSGEFVSKGTGLRNVKWWGSNKIGASCPSTILVHESSNGLINVKYYKSHYGHDIQIRRVPLTKDEQKMIADKLAKGMATEEIIDEMKSTETDSNIKRVHLIDYQDIWNIKRDFLNKS